MVGIFRDTNLEARPDEQPAAPAAADPDPGGPDGPSRGPEATGAPPHASLPLVALVLGIAGVVLGITVVWFFAAIPVGIVSVVLGVIARRHVTTYDDPPLATRCRRSAPRSVWSRSCSASPARTSCRA